MSDAIDVYPIHDHRVRRNMDEKGNQTFTLLVDGRDVFTSAFAKDVHNLASALSSVEKAVGESRIPLEIAGMIQSKLDRCKNAAEVRIQDAVIQRTGADPVEAEVENGDSDQ